MIDAITPSEILDGIPGYDYCCMFGVNQRKFRCDMWPTVFDEVGGIGYLARDGSEIIGQIIFMPKTYARRIALPTSPDNTNIEESMVISCLYVLPTYGGRGIGSKMISETLDFCRKHNFPRIEALVDRRPPHQSGFNTSFFPFKKYGFVLDNSREGCEFGSESRIAYIEFGKNNEP